ncbi:MAG: DUF5686 and carboxypeptidase regulatory-like domain-containing protein [Paludibacter sp.]|nr:DUF5686 and carboxypeptidase regulatory-like domain-containing protein [Paludibacter sp.]
MKAKNPPKLLIFIVLLLLPLLLQSQIRGVVIENDTRQPIPFVSIHYKAGGQSKVVIADKSGSFTITDRNIENLQITCVGYIPKFVANPENMMQAITIEMEKHSVALTEVTVSPKNNPAHRIIRLAIANKSQNNFENYNTYSYRNYFKSVLETIGSDSLRNDLDSVGFVSETFIQAAKQGTRQEEKIIATRTSGIESPILVQSIYSSMNKAISFYNASIPVFSSIKPANRMDYEYVTPLSNGSISIYNFTLENEFVAENKIDTIFEISFFPKKSTNIRGLNGTLYISSDGYALTCVVAQPYEKQGVDFFFKQEYQKTGGKWFPSNLEQMIRFGRFSFFPIGKLRSMYFVYSIVSNISDVKYTLDANLTNRIERIYLDRDSITYNRLRFDTLRPFPMTPVEISFDNRIDSLLTEMKKDGFSFDYMLNMLPKIGEYKLMVGKVDIDLGRIISQNKYEKTRWGLGFYSNEQLSKLLSAGGYFGYGTGDKRWKYGGSIEFTFQKSHDLKIKYQYQNTLKEAGKNLASNSVEWNADYLRSIIASRFDRIAEHRIEANYHPFRPLQLRAYISLKNLTPLYNYTYRNNPLSNFITDDINFSFRYAVNEIYGTLGNEKIRIQDGNPIINLSYTRGVSYFRNQSPVYNKFVASIDFQLYNGRIGQSNLCLTGGFIDRDLPYGLLFTGEGSRDQLFSLLIPNTFQTMNPYDFLSDRSVCVFYSHNFGALLFKTKNFKPEFKIAYNAGWGKLTHPQNHDISFQQYDNIYQETGLIIKKLVQIHMPFYDSMTLDMGIGGFFRIPQWQQNISLKFDIGLSF